MLWLARIFYFFLVICIAIIGFYEFKAIHDSREIYEIYKTEAFMLTSLASIFISFPAMLILFPYFFIFESLIYKNYLLWILLFMIPVSSIGYWQWFYLIPKLCNKLFLYYKDEIVIDNYTNKR